MQQSTKQLVRIPKKTDPRRTVIAEEKVKVHMRSSKKYYHLIATTIRVTKITK